MEISLSDEEREARLRDLLFIPCESREHLDLWVRSYIGIALPSVTVCREDADHEPSNSNPLDLLWEVYDSARRAERPETYLFYAARGTYKSVLLSIFELMAMFHLRRDCGHMAANKHQSQRVQEYLAAYLKRPVLRDYQTSKNESEISVTWHERGGEVIAPAQYKARLREGGAAAVRGWVEKSFKTTVVVATLGGTNSLHCSVFCVDGQTKMYVEGGDGCYHNRRRKAVTARGVFSKLLGIGRGGAPPGKDAPSISISDSPVDARVLSFNHDSGALEYRRVVGATRRRAPALSLRTARGALVCTADHPVWTMGRGYVPAGELALGDAVPFLGKTNTDRVASASRSLEPRLVSTEGWPESTEWQQVLVGTLLGDAGIYRKNGGGNPYVHLRHGMDQAGYCDWKKEVLARVLRFHLAKGAKSGYTGEAQRAWTSGHSPYLAEYASIRQDLRGLELVGPQALAVWYMDDGCAGGSFKLSTEGWGRGQNEQIARLLRRRFGLDVRVNEYEKTNDAGEVDVYYNILGGVEAKRRLVEVCREFVHPEVAYKFDLSRHRGCCKLCGREFWHYEIGGGNSEVCRDVLCRTVQRGGFPLERIEAIEDAGERWVYDFTVEGNHNFFGNGFLNKNCADELDLTPEEIISEAMMIPKPGKERGEPPIKLMTSSRKFAGGPVQNAIDAASRTGARVRHWNVIDVAQACPPRRHLPTLPKVAAYSLDETLETIGQDQYDELPKETQEKYRRGEAYAGCLTNCRMFAMCGGRLATEQSCDTPLLFSVEVTQQQFMDMTDVEKAQAQLLCWKPSRAGLIYPRLERARHVLSAAQIYQMMAGDAAPKGFGRRELLAWLGTQEVQWIAGLDHGYNHCFAGVLAFRWGNTAFVVDAFEVPGLETDGKVQLCVARFKPHEPRVWADPSHPGDNDTLRKHGLRVLKWKKGPGSVVDGIGAVRMKLTPVIGQRPELFFLAGDPGVEALFERLTKYMWVIDASTGEPTDQPKEDADDGPDAFRYCIMNAFPPRKGRVVTAAPEDTHPLTKPPPPPAQAVREQWRQIMGHVGLEVDEKGEVVVQHGGRIKKGNTIFDFG